jgi:drug/metabolite transporter (DMT)-like permease
MPARPHVRATDWLLLVLLSVLWGGSFFFAAVAVREIPPLTLVLARVALAAALLAPAARLLGLSLPRGIAAWRPYAVLALLNNLVPFSLIFYGQTQIASGLASVLNATTPLFTLVVARIFAGEPLTAARLGGVLLGAAGVAVLMGPNALSADAAGVLGMLCVLGAALSYSLSALWMRRLKGTPPLVSAQAQLMCSTAMLLPVAALADRFWDLPIPGAATVAAVLGLAAFSTALAYIVFFRISASAGPSNVMLVTLLIPVSATALGVLVLGERLAPHQVAGALVIASALVVIDGRLFGWMARRESAT